MHRDVIDGIPVLWEQAPGPLEAALVFGCGARDETFRTLGVTHLVEHLAMSTLPRLHHEHNAMVDLELTQFTATGRPEQIAAFLTLVCQALTDLPVQRIEQESGVLAAEDGCASHPTVGALLSHRYGIEGLGLAPWNGPGPDRIPLEAVRDVVARFFHAGNAVLVLTGPPPEGLRLPLPTGPRPARGEAQQVRAAHSRWQEDAVPGPGLGLDCDLAEQPLQLALAVLQERLRNTARHQHGLSYDVSCASAAAGLGRGERVVYLDAREGEEQRVAGLLWEGALKLAAEGPSEEEVAEEIAAARELFLDPRAVSFELELAASAELFGTPYRPVPERLALLEKVTAEQVHQAFARAMDSALLVVPPGTEVSLRRPDGSPLPEARCTTAGLPADGQQFRPSVKDRLFHPAARKARLVLNDAGVWLRDPAGDVHHIPYEEVVGVEIQGPGRTVFGAGPCVIPVLPEMFAGLTPGLRALDAAVPEELRYAASGFRSADN
ncbi:insulinase family protein [Kitasatospora herbaricolor]|uniref:insulinase family protein n=1 Tax=Kitasatospora herbaricolor TaxID=68217 RepID=UPI0036DF4393